MLTNIHGGGIIRSVKNIHAQSNKEEEVIGW